MSHAESGDDDVVLVGSISDQAAPVSGERLAVRAVRRQRRAVWAVVVGFGLLAIACAMTAILAWQNVRATDAVLDARQARRAGTVVLLAMTSAESSQRGFLITRDPEYLTPYDQARTDFRTWMAELRARIPKIPARQALADEVERIGTAKFQEMDRTITLTKSGQFTDALDQVRTGLGHTQMEELRRDVYSLTAGANDDVAQTTATQTRLSTMSLVAIVAALICVGAVASLLLRDTRRRIQELHVREASLTELADTLEQQVALRTRALAEVNQRFDAALRASGVTVMTQDRDLTFTWISQGEFGLSAPEIIGKQQPEVFRTLEQGAELQLKRGVIETGEAARADIRVVREGVETWFDLSVHPLTDETSATIGIITGAIDITRYKEQEARIRLLMREMTHRSKNLLSVIQAIMRQTAANSTSIEDFETRFSARLHSLAGSHDLLVREDWRGASLRELVRSQLGHYIDLAGSQFELDGEPLNIQPDAAQHIGMAMHELATNAAKFGALSVPSGKVRISWYQAPGPDDVPHCHLSWEESGGPPVERPSRRGFGRVVAERTVARAVQGEVTVDYAPTGLRWALVFPAAFLSASR